MPRTLRKRSENRAGRKWVDENFDLKHEIKSKNGGRFPKAPAFTTSDFEGGSQWSEECPPDILFYLQPPKAQFCDHEIQYALDENANIIMSPHEPDRELRAITALPDRISLDVPGWQITAWRRLDPRISLQDIVDRMTTDLGEAQKLTEKKAALPKKNSLQNRCMRDCRRMLKYYNDYGRRLEPHRAEVEAMEVLTMTNILFNTTLQYHPEYNRLIKVKFVRKNDGGKIYVQPMKVTEENLEETTYPIDYFLFEGYVPQLSDSMQEAIEMLWTLQERAVRHGLNPSYWKRLEKSCLPSSWFDRTSGKSSPNETFDGGCDVCTWSSDGDKQWTAVDFNKPPPRTPKSTKAKAESEDEHSDNESEQFDTEEIDETPKMGDIDETTHEYFTPSPEKAGLSHHEMRSTSISPTKRKAAEEDSPSPTKRKAMGEHSPSPTKRHTGACIDPSLMQIGNAGHTRTGIWSPEHLDPFVDENHDGSFDTGFDSFLHTSHPTAGYEYVNPASSMSSAGCVAPDDVWSPLVNNARAQDLSPENLDARLRASLDNFGRERRQNDAIDETQTTPTNAHHHTTHTTPLLDNPTLTAPFEIDENDPDFAKMLGWCQILSRSNSQTTQPDLPAAGVG